jgi:adenylate cyclase
MMKDQLTEDSPSFQKAVTHQIESILKSQDFNATPKQIAFLKFVINQALAGKGRKINDYTVAAEVFGRGPDFNAIIDPIVSIQADILRRKLARYYQNTGKNDPIRIDIPNGTYVPVCKKRKIHEE